METSRASFGASAQTFQDALAALDPNAKLADYAEVPVEATELEFNIGHIRATKWPVDFDTPAAPWSYAAYLSIPSILRRASNAILRVQTSIASGEPWIGVLTRDQKDFAYRTVLNPGINETLFSNLDVNSTSKIVFENGEKHRASRITIASVSVLVPVELRHLLLVEEGAPSPSMPAPARPRKAVKLERYKFVIHGLSEEDYYFDNVRDNFEPQFQMFCQQFVSEDAVCVDVGANIGIKSLYLSRHARKGRVVAIEAGPNVFKCLEMNVAANHASNIQCVQAAVGDRIGSVRFSESSAYGHIASEGIEVPMLTLQEIANRTSLPRADFIKMDVEGFEFPILRSAYDFINESRALVLFEFNSWCQLAFADINPKEFLTWIFDHFAYVGILRDHRSGNRLIEEVRKDQLLYVLHDNLVATRCVSDLIVTNATERL